MNWSMCVIIVEAFTSDGHTELDALSMLDTHLKTTSDGFSVAHIPTREGVHVQSSSSSQLGYVTQAIMLIFVPAEN